MSDVKKFPGHRWSPDGEMRVFHTAEDVPEGWADYHPDSRPPSVIEAVCAVIVAAEPKAPTLSRQQIIADLQRRGVVFQRNAATTALYGLLVSEVERSEA